jgi:hypothetical protein
MQRGSSPLLQPITKAASDFALGAPLFKKSQSHSLELLTARKGINKCNQTPRLRVSFCGGFYTMISIGSHRKAVNSSVYLNNVLAAVAWIVLFLVLSFPSISRAGASSGPQDVAAPKLAGQWQLNKDQSDDPRQKMEAARGDSSGSSGENDGGSRGQGGRNGGGRGQGGGMMGEMSVLQIEQTGSNVKITGKSGRLLAQYPAGDQSSAKSNGGDAQGQRTSTSQWQNGQLTVETDRPRGKSTRTYSLSPDGKQLFVTTKMENERLKQPVTYKLVYDSVAPAKAGGN